MMSFPPPLYIRAQRSKMIQPIAYVENHNRILVSAITEFNPMIRGLYIILCYRQKRKNVFSVMRENRPGGRGAYGAVGLGVLLFLANVFEYHL